MNNDQLIKQIKSFFEKENQEENKDLKHFSDDVVNTAFKKMSENVTTLIENEEDPLSIAEMLKSYLEITKMVDERGLQKQQFLLKLFEQLTKYEQSRYY